MRKIRCSGEMADGSGCAACQAVGILPGLCVFLRVKCESRELMPDHMLVSWPLGNSEPFSQDMNLERYHWVGPQGIETLTVNHDSHGEKQRLFILYP